MEVNNTGRGFERMEFADGYGEKCSIQKSSLATNDCIWFGIDKVKIQTFTPYVGWKTIEVECPPGGDVLDSGRMHLSRDQLKEILPHLISFVETGQLSVDREETAAV